MATVTVTEKQVKNKEQNLKEATASENLDTVLNNVKKIDTTCSFAKCKAKTIDFCINCKYCNNRFCTTHGLPEIHGCGEAVRKDERKKFVNNFGATKLTEEKHNQASSKLTHKLKQMQSERKAKQAKPKKK